MECNPIEYDKRPWGSYEVLLDSPECKVKRLRVTQNQRLSYQKHLKRKEIWTIVSGTATVTLDGQISEYTPGQIVEIPLEAAHRVANLGTEELIIIEIQRGTYFGEDDIIRLEDDYDRK